MLWQDWRMAKETMLTTPEVAERLGVTVRRVQALIKDGRLPSQQFGRDHLIKESDLKLVENRKPGRPPKQASKKGGS
jgi:excisionase family DNA binding protein